MIGSLAERRIILLSTHIVSDVEYIADEILMMKAGRLIHEGKPEAIVRQMEGKVWECHADPVSARQLASACTIANLRREARMVVLRVISDHPPCADARLLSPTLEDLYLYCFGEEQDDVHAGQI